jgi:hypothetical protein
MIVIYVINIERMKKFYPFKDEDIEQEPILARRDKKQGVSLVETCLHEVFIMLADVSHQHHESAKCQALLYASVMHFLLGVQHFEGVTVLFIVCFLYLMQCLIK